MWYNKGIKLIPLGHKEKKASKIKIKSIPNQGIYVIRMKHMRRCWVEEVKRGEVLINLYKL
jgi:hypothetical protein